MKKLLLFLLTITLMLGCSVDLPVRILDGIRNEIVMMDVDKLLRTDGFAGNSYQFHPVFSDDELVLIDAIEMKIVNSLDVVVAKNLIVKKNAAEVVEEAKGPATEEKPVKIETGWGKESFEWTPKDSKGAIFTFPPDSYRYIVTVYDRYQEPQKGKYTFEKAQKRVFVYEFDMIPPEKVSLLTIKRLKPEQDSGYSQVDGITNISENLSFRGILNLDPELIEKTGETVETLSAGTVQFAIKGPAGKEYLSPKINVASENAVMEEFADLEITNETPGIENFQFYKFDLNQKVEDGSYSIEMKLNYQGSTTAMTISSDPITVMVDTVAPIAYWRQIMGPEGNPITNQEKVQVKDTDINAYPQYQWNYDATDDGTRIMRNWLGLSFTDGTKPSRKNGASPLYLGTNITPLVDEGTDNGPIVQTTIAGVQEIIVDAYDLAGNKAIIGEGADSSVKIARRVEVLPPSNTIKQFENGGFEAVTGLKNWEDWRNRDKGRAPGWTLIVGSYLSWSTGNSYHDLTAENAKDYPTGPIRHEANQWNNHFCAGVFNEDKYEGNCCFEFMDCFNDWGSNRYRWTWGRLTQSDFEVQKDVTYELSAYTRNRDNNPPKPNRLVMKAQTPIQMKLISTDSIYMDDGYIGKDIGETKNYVWEKGVMNFTPNMAGKVELGIEKKKKGGNEDGGFTAIDNVSVRMKSYRQAPPLN